MSDNPIFGTPAADADYWRRPGVYAVITRHDGLIAVVEMSDGTLHLPGGGVEAWEDNETALLREIREETGLAVTIGACLGQVDEYAWSGVLGHFIKAGTYYAATAQAVLGPPEEWDHTLRWMSREEAAAGLFHAGQRWLLSGGRVG